MDLACHDEDDGGDVGEQWLCGGAVVCFTQLFEGERLLVEKNGASGLRLGAIYQAHRVFEQDWNMNIGGYIPIMIH